MALWDHRTFEANGEWWAAQVHGGIGVGTGHVPHITEETVYFTCLSDETRESLISHIPAGWLNRLNHASIVRLLERASPFGTRFEMAPYNAPDADELKGGTEVQDDEGLTWIVKEIRRPLVLAPGSTEHAPTLQLICLDDSALHGAVPFQDADTLADYRTQRGEEGLRDLVHFVKQDYEEFDPSDEDE